MYNLKQIKRAIRYPGLMASVLNKQYFAILQGGYPEYYQSGVDIFEEDWDNLIILDACRYEAFMEVAGFEGNTEARRSKGACSKEFIRGNFAERDLRDTVYVSANSWYGKLEDKLQSDLFKYRFVKRDVLNGLTSSPEQVTQETLEEYSKNPNKRFIIHYMQPHRPFIGPTGRELYNPHQPFVDMVANSEADLDQLRESYLENLRLVLDSVQTLVDELDGKTVISSDHGELLGDREFPIPIRHYGHPEGVFIDTLLKVPWHVIPSSDRRDIQSDEPIQSDHDAREVEQNLRDLGYLTPE